MKEVKNKTATRKMRAFGKISRSAGRLREKVAAEGRNVRYTVFLKVRLTEEEGGEEKRAREGGGWYPSDQSQGSQKLFLG